MYGRAAARYRDVDLESAPKTQIVERLFARDSSAMSSWRGRRSRRKTSPGRPPRSITRRRSSCPLRGALDHHAAPELCVNLDALYRFVIDKLTVREPDARREASRCRVRRDAQARRVVHARRTRRYVDARRAPRPARRRDARGPRDRRRRHARCRTAAAMLDARDAILARVPTLAGTIDPVKLADLEARDRRWSAALAGHLDARRRDAFERCQATRRLRSSKPLTVRSRRVAKSA